MHKNTLLFPWTMAELHLATLNTVQITTISKYIQAISGVCLVQMLHAFYVKAPKWGKKKRSVYVNLPGNIFTLMSILIYCHLRCYDYIHGIDGTHSMSYNI